MRRRDLISAVAGGAMAMIVAGGVAWAAIPGDGGVIQGCYLKGSGVLRVIDPTRGQSCLGVLENPITWNQKGQKGDPGPPGPDGTSPTVTQLMAGDPQCTAGGAAITDASGETAYVCNGEQGEQGDDGAPFSGTFESPNGVYGISVTDVGVTVSRGSHDIVRLDGTGLFVRADGTVVIEAETDLTMRAQSGFTLHGTSGGTVRSSGLLSIDGSFVNVNGSAACRPSARLGDTVGTGPSGGEVITTGSGSVCIG